MKRTILFLAASPICLSLACTETSDAWRAPVLIALGVLSVALLILFGRPSKKKPEPEPAAPEPDRVVTVEEPNEHPERS